MRLFLAVAVLVLALVAYAEAQDETLDQKFAKFGSDVSEMGKNLAEKAKTAFQDIKASETMATVNNWFSEMAEKVKNSFN